MNNNRIIKVGILGLGVIGSELVLQILNNRSRIEKETGISLEIGKIYVRTLTKTRTLDTTKLPLTTDVNDVINNPDIDIICECMGGNGYELTRGYILEAINNDKHLVMSSKKAFAKYAALLIKAADSHNVHLHYDACVGGGIPIAKVLANAFKGDHILNIMGIFNATSNYIYSKMFSHNLSFQEALKEAQDNGYAENDPSDDVDGYDSLYKLIILVMFGMKQIIDPSLLRPDSFRNIDMKDMQYANELGYRIKPLALLKRVNGTFEYKIGQCLIPSEHVIANTFNNFNSILIEGEHCGELIFYGQGAGAKPTATAMFDDLMNILANPEPRDIIAFSEIDPIQIVPYNSKLYWRFTLKNEVGVLSKFTSVLAENKINIEKFIQKEEVEGGIEVVLLSSTVKPSLTESILNELKDLNIINNSVIPLV
jgi:homoserine dehydrogenase